MSSLSWSDLWPRSGKWKPYESGGQERVSQRGSLSWDPNGGEKSDIIELNLYQVSQLILCFLNMVEFSANPCVTDQIHDV